MQYSQIYRGKPYVCPLRSNPKVGIPSGLLMGQKQARNVDVNKAMEPAANNTGAGVDVQNHFSPARAENNVRKSDTDTLRYMDVVI